MLDHSVTHRSQHRKEIRTTVEHQEACNKKRKEKPALFEVGIFMHIISNLKIITLNRTLLYDKAEQ